jgi:hypothetical protein
MRQVFSKLWNWVKEMSSLTPHRIREIEELIALLKAKQVPVEESKRYQLSLEQEKQKALEAGDVLVGMGLVLLGAALVMYLAGHGDST